MKKLIAGTIVALALPVSAAVAADHPGHAKSPAKACSALRADDAAAFKAQYRNFGKCVSAHAKARTRTTSAIHAQENAAQTCKAARSDDADAFSEQWGTGRKAFGKCVWTTARAAQHGKSHTTHGHSHSS
jgi:hypothetical protein